MSSFRKFEDILAWQKARMLTKRVYQVTRQEEFARDYGLRDQIRRASVSIMANIAEGFGRKTNKEFANFLVMSHGSAAEVQSHLYIALDLTYIDDETFKELYALVDEISLMIMALCQHLLKTA
ncbi:MAG: four helix bundle protein [Pyrinomonadaceae bacterium]|nr:four helix bundle protein [Pyrinomonadaceae bacterium]